MTNQELRHVLEWLVGSASNFGIGGRRIHRSWTDFYALVVSKNIRPMVDELEEKGYIHYNSFESFYYLHMDQINRVLRETEGNKDEITIDLSNINEVKLAYKLLETLIAKSENK